MITSKTELDKFTKEQLLKFVSAREYEYKELNLKLEDKFNSIEQRLKKIQDKSENNYKDLLKAVKNYLKSKGIKYKDLEKYLKKLKVKAYSLADKGKFGESIDIDEERHELHQILQHFLNQIGVNRNEIEIIN